ncbi:MAG TPA: O-antigen ligase family protein, partial [Opitutus sp.]|nr:O-antigen ligase family protein [Opitutus sp.]
MLISGAWFFGGNSSGARLLMSAWGSLGLVITIAALRPGVSSFTPRQTFTWLWPLAAFNGLVLLSAVNPSFREVVDGTQRFYLADSAKLPLPSSARPDLSWRSLWFFDAIYLSCFNLLLVVRERRALRLLLLVLLGNAVLLAVFGTVQKLVGAEGLYFGLVPSPQPFFFASFVYHNHWGAFALLMGAMGCGLLFHFARRGEARDFWHSPAFVAAVGIGLLAATIPLSGSRSCTILITLLIGGALVHGLRRLRRSRKGRGGTGVWPVAATLLAAIAMGAFGYHLARPTIHLRIANTRGQLAEMQARGDFGSRQTLYRDTWNLAREKRWFGWGMGAFPTAFFHRNTQRHESIDGLPRHFHDAHSDWLQSAAEVGIVGTVLLGLCGIVPLYQSRRALTPSPLAIYLGLGCAVVLLYAWLEFPFGNRAVVAAWWLCFF